MIDWGLVGCCCIYSENIHVCHIDRERKNALDKSYEINLGEKSYVCYSCTWLRPYRIMYAVLYLL